MNITKAILKKGMVWLLALAMLVTFIPMAGVSAYAVNGDGAAAAEQAEANSSFEAKGEIGPEAKDENLNAESDPAGGEEQNTGEWTGTIDSNGIYDIPEGTTGVITVNATDVTLRGMGIDKPYRSISIQCQKAGTSLTIENLAVNNSADQNIINFKGEGNTLTIKGRNLLDHGGGYIPSAAIHVNASTELALSGSGSLYLYKNSQGSGIGSNANEKSGKITFGSGNYFIKGTKTGAVIGTDLEAAGDIYIKGGNLNLVTKARCAAIGGSAQTTCGNVYMSGGNVTIYVDSNGSAIGRGATYTGTDFGKLEITGGSLKTYVTANGAGFGGWGTEGVYDGCITAAKKNASNEDVHKLAIDVSSVSGSTYQVKVDGKEFYEGGLHKHQYTDANSTVDSWTAATDKNLYLYLPEGKHVVDINGTEYEYKWTAAGGGSFELLDADAQQWNEATDTTWYDETADSFTLDKPAQLAGLAKLVNAGNDFTGKSIKLRSDIDLNDGQWLVIGNKDNPFRGTFDGNGNTVKGLKITSAADGYKGLFGNNEGTIKNLKVRGSIGTEAAPITSGSDNIGGIAGYNKGTITNVESNVKVYVNSSKIYAVGGVVGQNDGNVEKAVNKGNVTGTKCVGGVCGRNYGTIDNSVNKGDVTGNGGGKDSIGGIVGQAGNKSGTAINTVSNSYNTGSINNPNGRWFGGIAGFADKGATVRNCYNSGNIASGYSWSWNPIIGNVDGGTSNPTCENNYSLEGLNAGDTNESTRPLTVGEVISAEDFKKAEIVKKLGAAYSLDGENTNNGFPVLSWQVAANQSGNDDGTASSDTDAAAKTGDNISLLIWMILMAMAIAGAAVTASYRRKKASK